MEIGAKLRDLRASAGLTQEDIANRAGLTKGFISQLERNHVVPALDNLLAILEALDTTPAEFFSDQKSRPVVFPKADRVLEDWGEGVSRFEILVSSTESKQMEPALVKLLPGQSLEKTAHKGEEFGLLLAGKLSLQIGKRNYTVRAGDCFYCEGKESHRLENIGKVQADLLWITTPPAF